MLTAKQKTLLQFIHLRLKQDGVSPSFDEMKDAVGLKSKSGIHRLIGALEERGFLERLPNRARALRVVRMPDDVADLPSAASAKESGTVIQGQFGQPAAAQPAATNDSMVTIPLHGKIAAGTPIEALEHVDSYVDIPAHMASRDGTYALTVSGDSMVDKGIMDGDTVVIQSAQTARDGEIVVALVDGEEATLKTLRRDGNRVLLIPANSEHQPQQYAPDRVKVQGKLVGLYRTYH